MGHWIGLLCGAFLQVCAVVTYCPWAQAKVIASLPMYYWALINWMFSFYIDGVKAAKRDLAHIFSNYYIFKETPMSSTTSFLRTGN